MSWLDTLRARRTADRDLADEIQQHLDEKIHTLVAEGVAPDAAAARARREFGNVTLIAERSREGLALASGRRRTVRCALRRAAAPSLAGRSDAAVAAVGVKPLDAPTFAIVALLLLGVAAFATYLPARRATSVDPMLALCSE